MIIVENSIIPFGGFKAVTVGPWIFCRSKDSLTEIDINHEAIHWEQYKELLIVGFPVVYLLLWIVELVRCLFDGKRGCEDGRRRGLLKRAYRSVALEREAYGHQTDLGYIGRRKRYNWLFSFA